jgi:hypothetical protein
MNAPAKITAASPAVYAAIAAVQGELAKVGIAKNRKNTQGSGYNFRGIDDVYSALSPLLASHGLCVLPRVMDHSVIERQSKNGGALFYTTVKAEFDFVAVADGSIHTCATFGEAMDSGDKSTNKAMSAAYKYAAFMAFAIPVEGEPDADASTHEVARTGPEPRQKLEGPHTSKTGLKQAIHAIITAVRAAETLEAIDALKEEHKRTINQARRDWPELIDGDPKLAEDTGLAGAFAERREQLTAGDAGMLGELLTSMRQCETIKAFTGWMASNEAVIDALDDTDRRRLERERDQFESGLTLVAQRN